MGVFWNDSLNNRGHVDTTTTYHFLAKMVKYLLSMPSRQQYFISEENSDTQLKNIVISLFSTIKNMKIMKKSTA